MAEVEDVKVDERVTETTEEVRRLSAEDRAARFFRSQIAEEKNRIERRELALAEVLRKDPRDQNAPDDRDYIEQRKALLRGYEDAVRGAEARAVKAKEKAELAKRHPDKAALAALTGK